MHYLIDFFATPLLDGRIIDVLSPPDGRSLLAGTLLVRVPDDIAIAGAPTTLDALLDQKHKGILGKNAGYTRLVTDDLTDLTGMDFTLPGISGHFGDRGILNLAPGCVLNTVLVPLAGAAPGNAILDWECHQIQVNDDKLTPQQQLYVEVSPDALTVEASFDNGVNYNVATPGATLVIPPSSAGTDLLIRFTNSSTEYVYLDSWSLVY